MWKYSNPLFFDHESHIKSYLHIEYSSHNFLIKAVNLKKYKILDTCKKLGTKLDKLSLSKKDLKK